MSAPLSVHVPSLAPLLAAVDAAHDPPPPPPPSPPPRPPRNRPSKYHRSLTNKERSDIVRLVVNQNLTAKQIIVQLGLTVPVKTVHSVIRTWKTQGRIDTVKKGGRKLRYTQEHVDAVVHYQASGVEGKSEHHIHKS